MAAKSKKKDEEPVVAPPRAYRDPESGEVRVEVNGVSHPIGEQDLLALRREIDDLSAGFVH